MACRMKSSASSIWPRSQGACIPSPLFSYISLEIPLRTKLYSILNCSYCSSILSLFSSFVSRMRQEAQLFISVPPDNLNDTVSKSGDTSKYLFPLSPASGSTLSTFCKLLKSLSNSIRKSVLYSLFTDVESKAKGS